MTITELNELKAKRATHIGEARKLLDKANTEKRELNTEERTQYDSAHGEAKKLKTRIDDEERQLQLDDEARQTRPPVNTPAAGGEGQGSNDDEERSLEEANDLLRTDTEEARALVRIFKQMTGREGGSPNEFRREAMRKLEKGTRGSKQYRQAFEQLIRTGRPGAGLIEARDAQADSQADGGYMLAPAQMVNTLIKTLDNTVHVRGLATRFATGHSGLGAVSLDADVDDFDWTVELATGDTTGVQLGKREMKPHPLAKRALFSKTLARNAPDVIALLNQRLAYKLGITQEKAYLTGDGQQKPLGVMTASNDGIPTSRDVSTGNLATSIQVDGLKNAKWSLKSEHRRNARWMFHRDGLTQIDKLKDGNGQYLWQASVVAGQPDRLLNLPIDESEYMPNTFTSGLYVGILANWQYYWILDSLDLAIQVLVELYAGTNKNGIHARYEGDGMPVLSEAFTRVKLG